mgnify:CR=1 FL=1
MESFWLGFLANLLPDALLAFAIFLIITRPSERRRVRKRRVQALGLLKTEIQTNLFRAQLITKAINNKTESQLICPLHFTRGAWNALRESGYLSELDDPRLALTLFQMNELAMTSNNNLRLWERAYLEDESKRTEALRSTCLRNCNSLNHSLQLALDSMGDIEAQIFEELQVECDSDDKPRH